ncbi:MAG: Y-family DNA polymerase [Sphingobacteriales bacterium]|jgi:DNA polymerase V
MRAIVDCNSFYCSCERLFRPDLVDKPVVVLSNNDGCIIARSDEAKAAGLAMGAPYFQTRDLIREKKVAVFSSNYNLYGDLSMRVMDTLRTMLPPDAVEVYSVDEAFLDLSHIAPHAYEEFALELRHTIETWTGIKVSVGVAPSKLLSKMANKLSKRNKEKTKCVMVLDTPAKIEAAMMDYEVGDLWGIGGRYARKLREMGINTAWQLKHMPEEWARKNLGGVVGVRLIRELHGISCIPMKDPLEVKKMIATTRMFGRAVYTLPEIRQAVAAYTARAAEKLRRQGHAAALIDVFVVTNGQQGEAYAYDPRSDHRYIELSRATSDTSELQKYALPLVEELYRPGVKYLKAGVILSHLVPDEAIQTDLFSKTPRTENKKLMEAMDNINFSMRDDMVRFMASGLARQWKMKQEMCSKKFTTRWDELYRIS